MFQVLVQYLDDRYASFLVDTAIHDYSELMRLILRAVPFWNEKSSNLRIAYKDVELNSFINIEADEPMHLVEAYRNARNSGSDVYRRVTDR